MPPEYRDLLGFLSDPRAEYSLAVQPAVGAERKIDTVLKQLKDGVEGIQDSTRFRLFLTTMSKFHDYSIGNLILIALQKPEATKVAGFVTWKNLGRWVRKGEKGIAILAPMMPAKKKEEEDEEELEARPTYFKVVHVFDISQTEGEPLPEFEVPVLTGEANEELFAKALGLAKSRGLEVSFESRPTLPPEVKGQFLAPKQIWVRPEEPRAQQLKTLLHEEAHYYSEGVFRIPRRDAETIAESASFAIGAHYGFDTGVRSFPYVALWAKDKKVLQHNLGAVRKVVTVMLEELDKPQVAGEKFIPALKPFEPYHFAEYVLRYNRFSEAEIPIYSGLTGRNPLRVPDRIWREVLDTLDGEFVKQGQIYIMHAPEKGRPEYMRAAPTWRDVASTVPVKKVPGVGNRYVPDTDLDVEAVKMFCQRCGKEVEKPSDFRTAENLRLFMITGLCQDCQDRQRGKEYFGERPGEKKVTYIKTKDGQAKVEWWYPADFAGRTTEIFAGGEHEVIQIPDQIILCDFCNAEITDFPVAVLWGTHALCTKCLEKVQKEAMPAVIPTKRPAPSPKDELEFVSDSPEFLAYTVEDIGYRGKLDTAFETAIAKAQGA